VSAKADSARRARIVGLSVLTVLATFPLVLVIVMCFLFPMRWPTVSYGLEGELVLRPTADDLAAWLWWLSVVVVVQAAIMLGILLGALVSEVRRKSSSYQLADRVDRLEAKLKDATQPSDGSDAASDSEGREE
jgi:uncharacterized protein involved in cysteine biosynthesis